MYTLSDQQIDFILNDIRLLGIRTESIQHNLLDHVCIIIEQGLEEGGNFELFYASAIRGFYRENLREIEEAANFLLTCRNAIAVFSRSQFFVILFAIFIGPYIGYDIFWMINSAQPSGWSLPFEIWGSTVSLAAFPLLVLFVLLFTPERLDPLIPKNSKVIIGRKPFIRVVPGDALSRHARV